MNRYEKFAVENLKVNQLDSQGKLPTSSEMYHQYQIRNSFGLDPSTKIHRIFQHKYYESDCKDGYLTLPRATKTIWNDPLENPLSEICEPDLVTGLPIHLGSLVSNFFALCWTNRPISKAEDWASFSHGVKAIRISTTAGKLMDRMMSLEDPGYMHRSWLVQVEYKDPKLIIDMMKPSEVYKRMESSGSSLAASAAYIRNTFSCEDEVRFLFDTGIHPSLEGIVWLSNDLIRIPFNWDGFIDKIERN